MDYNPTSRILVLAGQPSNPNEPTLNHGPMYAAYQMKPKSLESLGMMRVPENTQSVSKLRFLAKGSDTFVAGKLPSLSLTSAVPTAALPSYLLSMSEPV